jgi:hypothetical protein
MRAAVRVASGGEYRWCGLCGGLSACPHVYLPPRVGGCSRCIRYNPTIDDVINIDIVNR